MGIAHLGVLDPIHLRNFRVLQSRQLEGAASVSLLLSLRFRGRAGGGEGLPASEQGVSR
jgi:hypothetical protein